MAVPYKLVARHRALDTAKPSVHDHIRSAKAQRRLVHQRWVIRKFSRKVFRKS